MSQPHNEKNPMEKKANKTKKTIQAKDKRVAKKDMGTLQENYQNKVREFLLHLPCHPTKWVELAHWTYVGKGECGCLYEIRFENTASPMLQLQYKFGRKRCGLLRKDVSRNRPRGNEQTPTRQISNRESIRLLSTIIRGLPTDKGIIRKI